VAPPEPFIIALPEEGNVYGRSSNINGYPEFVTGLGVGVDVSVGVMVGVSVGVSVI
jgi:hypothetical protein